MYICAKFNLAQDSRGQIKKGESVVLLSPITAQAGQLIAVGFVAEGDGGVGVGVQRFGRKRELSVFARSSCSRARSPMKIDVAWVARLPPGILLVAEIVPRPQISGHNTTVLLSIL